MKIGYFSISGYQSNNYGIFVTGKGTYDPAEADVTSYVVPGRNGEIKLFNHRYKNIKVTYPCFIPGNFEAQAQTIRNWLTMGWAQEGYATISDNYDTDHYRLGIVESMRFDPVNQNSAANFTVSINCKPQRFLNSGKTSTSITSGYSSNNQTRFDAKPVIQFKNPTSTASITFTHSLGTFTMNATRAYTGSVTIDCDTQNISGIGINLNDLFTGDFPVLMSGITTITFSGLSNVSIIPRWWEL